MPKPDKTPASIIIEPALSTDIPQLVALLRYLFSIEADFAVDIARQQRGLEQLIAAQEAGVMNGKPAAMVMVARDHQNAGSAIAMASAQFVISTAEGAYSAWIEDVVVHPDHRSAGIGARLLDALLAWAKTHGATRAQLVIDKTNTPAELFYRKNGWTTTRLEVRRRLLHG